LGLVKSAYDSGGLVVGRLPQSRGLSQIATCDFRPLDGPMSLARRSEFDLRRAQSSARLSRAAALGLVGATFAAKLVSCKGTIAPSSSDIAPDGWSITTSALGRNYPTCTPAPRRSGSPANSGPATSARALALAPPSNRVERSCDVQQGRAAFAGYLGKAGTVVPPRPLPAARVPVVGPPRIR